MNVGVGDSTVIRALRLEPAFDAGRQASPASSSAGNDRGPGGKPRSGPPRRLTGDPKDANAQIDPAGALDCALLAGRVDRKTARADSFWELRSPSQETQNSGVAPIDALTGVNSDFAELLAGA